MLQHNLCCEGELFLIVVETDPGVDLYDIDQLISNTLVLIIK